MLDDYLNVADEIFNTLELGFLFIDPNGIIKLVNKKWGIITNVDVTSWTGKKYYEVIPWLEFDNLFNKNKKIQVYEFSEKATYFAECLPIEKNGKINGVICVLHHKQRCQTFCKIIQKYKQLNEELNDIIESSYDGIWVSDREGVTIRVNSAYERITGIKVKDVLGQKPKDLVQRGLYATSVTEPVLRSKKRMTIVNTTATGKKILVTGNPILDEQGNVKRIVTNVRDITELSSLQRELELLSRRYEMELQMLSDQNAYGEIIARSEGMKNVLERARRVARADSTVLITGESGVGKEVVAKLIHRLSNRREGPFIEVNCGAIPESLIESELFGYEKGAFTGAKAYGKPGMFELANGGTLFLDEIAEIPLNIQVKLLRVLQEQVIIRVGGTKPIKLDIRLIAATNRNLEEMVTQKKFREDLYYRINVIPIHIPPLRMRKEDIPFLIKSYLDKFNEKNKTNKYITPQAIDKLVAYPWPGNVRELINILERMVVLAESDRITETELPACLQEASPNNKSKEHDLCELLENIFYQKGFNLKNILNWVEYVLLKKALQQGQTTRKAAEILGVDQSTVVRKAQKYNIDL